MGTNPYIPADVLAKIRQNLATATLEDTFGPNPCRRFNLRNEDTGKTISIACDSKRCKDCGPRKEKLFYDSARTIGETGWVHTYQYKAEVDAVLEKAKKQRQRNGQEFTYLVVGDEELGFILWTDVQIDHRLRRMALKDWKKRLIHAWKYADRRLRRSQGLQRLSLVAHISRRVSGDTPWKPVFRRLLSTKQLMQLEQDERDQAFADAHGWQVWDDGDRIRSVVESNDV